MPANQSAGHATEFENIGRNVVVASKRGLVETEPTVLAAMDLHPEYCWEGMEPVYSHCSQHFCTSEFLLKLLSLCTRNAKKLLHKDMIQVANLENRESCSNSDVEVLLVSVFVNCTI